MTEKDNKNIVDKRISLIYSELKSTIKRKGFTQKELGEKLDLYSSQQALSQAINKQTMKLDGWLAIGDVMEMDLIVKLVDRNNESDSSGEGKYMECLARVRELEKTISDLRQSVVDKQIIIDMMNRRQQ